MNINPQYESSTHEYYEISADLTDEFNLSTKSQTIAGFIRPDSIIREEEKASYLRIQFYSKELDERLQQNITWVPAVSCSELYANVTSESDIEFMNETFGRATWLCPDTSQFQLRGNGERPGT